MTNHVTCRLNTLNMSEQLTQYIVTLSIFGQNPLLVLGNQRLRLQYRPNQCRHYRSETKLPVPPNAGQKLLAWRHTHVGVSWAGNCDDWITVMTRITREHRHFVRQAIVDRSTTNQSACNAIYRPVSGYRRACSAHCTGCGKKHKLTPTKFAVPAPT